MEKPTRLRTNRIPIRAVCVIIQERYYTCLDDQRFAIICGPALGRLAAVVVVAVVVVATAAAAWRSTVCSSPHRNYPRNHGFRGLFEPGKRAHRQRGKRRTVLATERREIEGREERVHVPRVQVSGRVDGSVGPRTPRPLPKLPARPFLPVRIYSDIVKAAHLRPLTKKEIEAKGQGPSAATWNTVSRSAAQDVKQNTSDFVSMRSPLTTCRRFNSLGKNVWRPTHAPRYSF